MPQLNVSSEDFLSILPALALVAGAVLAVGIEVFVRREVRRAASELAMYAALLGSLAFVFLRLGGASLAGFGGAVKLDALALFLSFGILAATGLTAVLSADVLRDKGVPAGEFHAILLLGAAGMLLLVQSLDLVTFFVALEILSLAVYVLSGSLRNEPRSNEAAAKYLLLGAFATGFLLYGIALLYGATGSLSLYGIHEALATQKDLPPLALLGFSLLAIGLAFKVGAVPFHQWVPDVYEGAPTAVTAFMSVAVKAAAFGALLRVLMTAGLPHVGAWKDAVVMLALATMVVANLLALWQRNVKRMLAYSSVAHTGYLLAGVAALASEDARGQAATAAVFYLFSYTFMTLGAFAFVVLAGRGGRDAEDLDDYAGLAKRRPWSALAMTVFMASLAGLPPTAGFLGKFLVFKAAVAAGETALVVVGVLGSAVSVCYYLRVVVAMYMQPEPSPSEEPAAANARLVVMACALFTLILGLVPGTFLHYSKESMLALLR
jgi:NADH-quinone oxidoreductase subunit N